MGARALGRGAGRGRSPVSLLAFAGAIFFAVVDDAVAKSYRS